MYTRNLTKGVKSYSGKSRSNPSKLFRQGQTNRLRAIVANRNRPQLAQIRYQPINRREIKCLDASFTEAYNSTWTQDTFPQRVLNINYVPSFQSVNLIQQGPAISQRIGNKVALKSIRLRFGLSATGGGIQGDSYDTRVMLVYDRQPNGAYPSVNDLFNGVDQANAIMNPTQSELVTSNLNPNNFERFTVLMDKMYTIPSPTIHSPTELSSGLAGPTGDGQGLPWFIDEYIKLKGLECTFKGQTNPEVVGDITTGNLFLVGLGEYSAPNTFWALKGHVRLRFYDN